MRFAGKEGREGNGRGCGRIGWMEAEEAEGS